MLIDKLNTFAWESAFTVTAITDVIDLLPAAGALNAGTTGGPTANTIRDIGAGQPLYLHALVSTSIGTATGDTSTVFSLESDSTANLATSATVHWTSAAFATNASLVAGTWIVKGLALPAGAYERYLGMRLTISTQNWNAGKISAWISNNRMDDRAYQSGWLTGVN